jgi:hypothetical protein
MTNTLDGLVAVCLHAQRATLHAPRASRWRVLHAQRVTQTTRARSKVFEGPSCLFVHDELRFDPVLMRIPQAAR